MNRLRGLGVSIVVLAGGLFPVATVATPACAASANSAALVVDTGGSATAYCVELPSGSVNGIDLIKLASKQYGLGYNLGFGGKAVCALNGVGVTDSGDCFAQMPDYWGLWMGNGSGGWTWSSVGAASVSVGPGDVQGWAWGSGKDGSSHPAPPNTDYSKVCKVKDESDDKSSGGGTTGGSGGSGGTPDSGADGTGGDKERNSETDPGRQADGMADGGDGERAPAGSGDGEGEGEGAATGERDRDRSGATGTAVEGATVAAAEPDTSPVVLAAPIAQPDSAGGPPAGALAAIAVVALLGLGGAVMTGRGRGGRHRAGHARKG